MNPTEQQLKNREKALVNIKTGKPQDIGLTQPDNNIVTNTLTTKVIGVDTLNKNQDIINPATTDTIPPTPPTPDLPEDVNSAAPLPEPEKERQRRSLIEEARKLMGSLGGQAAARTEAEKQFGIEDKRKQLQNIQNRLKMLQTEAQQIPLQLQEDVTGRGVTKGGLAPIQASALRKNAIAQLGANAAFQAAAGNLQLAQDFIDRAVAAEFDPIKEKLDIVLKNLDLVSQLPDLTPEEKKQVEDRKAQVEAEKKATEERQAEKQKIRELTINAIAQGADEATQAALERANTLEEAMRIVANAGLLPEDIQRETVRLDNGNTVVIDPVSGQVIANLGGADISSGAIANVAAVPLTDPNYTQSVIKASAGGKDLTGNQTEPISKAFTVLGQIGELAGNIASADTGPILGVLRSANPYDTKAQLIKAQLISIVPALARGIYGEVGVLTDTDVARYEKTLPNLRSQEDLKNALLGMTLRTIQRSVQNQLEVMAASGRDVSGFAKLYERLEKQAKEIEGKLGMNKPTTLDEAGVTPEDEMIFDNVVTKEPGYFKNILRAGGKFIGSLFGQ